jgi:hypothetical protein
MDGDYFERFILAQRREDCWHSTRQHCFSRAWGPDEQHVVATGRSDFKRALGKWLTDDIGEISCVDTRCRRPPHRVCRCESSFAKLAHELAQRGRRRQRKRAYSSCFEDVGRRKYECRDSDAQSVTGDRKRATQRPQPTVETEFADEHSFLDSGRLELPCGYENPDSDREIECGSFFPDVCRCKIDRNPFRRNFEPGIHERGTNTFAAFFHSASRKSDNRPLRQALSRVDLYGDVVRVDADESGRTHSGKHRVG